MITLYANRALGILSSFLRENEHVTTWLLPANICFSVPFTFLSLGRHIEFYDFDPFANTVYAALSKHYSTQTGVLLLNHYGLPYDDEVISTIKQYAALLIVDACLSPPSLLPLQDLKADLTLYSTGKGKVIELGYGAFGHVKSPLRNQSVPCHCPESLSTAYTQMETYWKSVLNGTPFDSKAVFTADWIDEGNQLVTSSNSYLQTIEKNLECTLLHKSKLNALYSSEIDPDFHWHPSGNDWRFNILVDDPKLVIQEIFSVNLFASQHYANAAAYISNNRDLKNADLVERHMVNLFNSPNVTQSFAQQCADIISRLIRQGKLKPIKLLTL